jgi:transcription antitermination factor NusG
MSVFAVRVYTGHEIQVKDMLERVLKQSNDQWVTKIHAFETFTQRFSGKTSAPKKFKGAVPGYIFIELKANLTKIPAQLWHIIKKIPKVCQIFKENIPQEEFEHLIETADIEPDIELNTPAQVMEPEEERRLLHEANMAKTPEDKKKILEKMDLMTESDVQQINDMKARNKEGRWSRLLKRCRAYIKNKKARYTIPFSLFKLTRQQIDPNQEIPIEKITNGEFLVPELVKTLKSLLNE